MSNTGLPRKLFVRTLSAEATQGFLDLGFTRLPCVIGRSGRRAMKREGDGASPRGTFGLHYVYFRPDRGRRPDTCLPVIPLTPADGWCDAPGDRNYNRPVQHPYPQSAERLWRDDHLYDVIGVLDYNIHPRCQGQGSAIFLHIAHPKGRPTEGCIGVSMHDMKRLLRWLSPKTKIHI